MHDDWPEDALHRGLKQRDAHALEQLIRRYSREVTYFIRTVMEGVGTPQDAEECANDLFVTVWQEIDSFDAGRGSLRTWLTMRAKYIALDRRRHIQRRQGLVTSLDSGESGHPATRDGRGARSGEGPARHLAGASMERLLEQRERGEELRAALETLPTLDRKLVYMRYLSLKTTEEIARATGLTRHAIDTRLWRARKSLRVVLGEQAKLGEHLNERVRSL